jgi:chorismate lyase / 3-hydroxybenzoate synthase
VVFDVDYRNEWHGGETAAELEVVFTDQLSGLSFSGDGALRLDVNIDVVAGSPTREVWTTPEPLEGCEKLCGTDGAYVHTRNIFMCAGLIPEQDSYSAVTEEAYREAISAQRKLGFPYLVRMWNYLGDINGMNSENLEIYRDFCRGRAQAFEQLGVDGTHMPAATGIGKSDPGIVWYYLASRTPIVQNIENPNQMPAYTYPRRYGPKSPSFSRASRLVRAAESAPVKTLVSGTAAIIGHESQHIGNVDGQLDITFQHLAHFCDAGSRYSEVKVYYRCDEDVPTIIARCTEFFGPEAKIIYLKSDVCREELLVEIEGVVKEGVA